MKLVSSSARASHGEDELELGRRRYQEAVEDAQRNRAENIGQRHHPHGPRA